LTSYDVLVSKTAIRELNELEEIDQERIKDKLRELSKDPHNSLNHLDTKKLVGTKRTYYRLRVGEYRVIYFIEDMTIKVVRIATRSDVYSWLD
jgi:mRNA interferase RelE/StbE